jgi:transglutaminase-like putative cysteine protease
MDPMDDNRSFRIETIVIFLTYIVGALALLSVVREIESLYSIVFCVLFAISLYFEYKRSFRIPRWLLTTLSLAIVVFAIYRLDMQELVTQMLEALLILLAIKLLEEKKVRDYMQIYTITLLLLSGSGLLSLNLIFFGFYLMLILLLTVAAILLTYHAQDHGLVLPVNTIIKIVTKSLLIPLLAIPLTFLMFVILPRTPYPLLNFLNRPDKARTGFTDQVRLGAVSDIQDDSTIVLRANMEKINEGDLYWRGIVLEYFDGRSWVTMKKKAAQRSFPGQLSGKGIRQTVYLEPYGNTYLFSLDRPVLVTGQNVRKSQDLTYSSTGHIDTRLKYDAISVLGDSIWEADLDEERYLQVPKSISPRIKRLAQDMTMDNKEKTMQAIFNYLRSNEFTYSLKGLPVSKNPLEDFLFETKSGNCEFFASALAVMLRLNGIPARLVGGYRGGYYNDVGQYYLVPQKYAHAWVEAYVKPKGWVRLDPTPAALDSLTSLSSGGNFLKLSILVDTLNYYWYVLVINYNLEKQFSILLKLRSELRNPQVRLSAADWVMVIKWLGCILMFMGAAAALVVLFKSGRKPVDRRILELFLKKMEKKGYRKKSSQGLEEFISHIQDDGIRQSASVFVKEFEVLYFKDKTFGPQDIQKLKTTIKTIGM